MKLPKIRRTKRPTGTTDDTRVESNIGQARKIGQEIGEVLAEGAIKRLAPPDIVLAELDFLVAGAAIDITRLGLEKPEHDLVMVHIREAAITALVDAVATAGSHLNQRLEGFDAATFNHHGGPSA